MTQARAVGYRRLLDAVASPGPSGPVWGGTVLAEVLMCREPGGERKPPVTMSPARYPTEAAGPQAALGLVSCLNTKGKAYPPAPKMAAQFGGD